MAISDNGYTVKSPFSFFRLTLFLALMAFGWSIYDYFWGLVVMEVKVVAITADPVRPDLREIRFTVLSDFSEYPFISAGVRRFFRIQPIVCFVYPDGTELVNDDVKSPCMLEDDEFEKKGKSHHRETSIFTLPVFLQPGPLNQKKIFLKHLRKQKGMWIKFSLGGHILPPAVKAQPVFLSLEPYCANHIEVCRELLGN